jgi:predicted enzyme related to lactoylglutathione lyase
MTGDTFLSAIQVACQGRGVSGNNVVVPPDEVASGIFRRGGVSYLRIPAPDPQRTAAFYEAVFGWTVDANRPDPSFEDGSGHVIGHFNTDHAVAGEAGIRPYVYVDSIDDALEKVTAQGAAVVTEPYPEGELWVATFRDPAGNVVGVWQRGPRR